MGYHYTGEYRSLVGGELFLNGEGLVIKPTSTSYMPYHIVEKERWEPKLETIVWYITPALEIAALRWGNGLKVGTTPLNAFKLKAIAEIARSNIHALLKEADLNNMD